MLKKNLRLNPANVVVPLFIVLFVLYQSTIMSLFRLWTSSPKNPTYTHGLLLLAVCAVLFYELWTNKVRSIHLQPNAHIASPMLVAKGGVSGSRGVEIYEIPYDQPAAYHY